MPSLPSPSVSWPSWLPRPEWTRRVRPEVLLAGIVAVAVVVVLGVGLLRSGDSFDRRAAVDRVVEAGAGRITADQAGCYVDRVRKEVGARYLAPDAQPPDDVVTRMTSIRVDCVGVANLGLSSTTSDRSTATAVPSTESGNLPRQPGDDATLDQLYGECRDGFGQACDDLFAQAPVGSVYESFAVTCGERTKEQRCADVYVSPGVTNVPTTTAPG